MLNTCAIHFGQKAVNGTVTKEIRTLLKIKFIYLLGDGVLGVFCCEVRIDEQVDGFFLCHVHILPQVCVSRPCDFTVDLPAQRGLQ